MRGSLLLILSFTIIHADIYSDYSRNELPSIHKAGKDKRSRSIYNQKDELYSFKNTNEDRKDVDAAKKRAEVLNKVKAYEKRLNDLGKNIPKAMGEFNIEKYHRDPVLNELKRSFKHARRARSSSSDSSSLSSSSSLELKNWKEEWKEHWLEKKLEAINSSIPKGDAVNMVAARPWGVPCGDPNQHDMPWGTCMLPMQCEAEYRIYRGDYFCGRTQFVCCALQVTNYDLYAGFDVSFADSSFATDSEEKKNRDRGSKERKKRKRKRDRKRRARARLKRKRKIKRTIEKIIREIRKILNRNFRNGTKARKRKTKQLKKFVKELKKQYLKDRKSVKDIHEIEMIKIDSALLKRLQQINNMNTQFSQNKTFRDIVVNGTINKKTARLLAQAYPELADLIPTSRRANVKRPKDYLEYDIEYGYLYY